MSVAIVQAGKSISLEVTYDSAVLFVAAKIFDDSGVSPVLVATLAMDSFFGNSYRAKFTPVAGKTYVANKAVYTDGTFVTMDNNYSQGSDSFQAVDFAVAVLDVAMGAHDLPGTVGEAIANAGGSGGSAGSIVGIMSDDEPVVGVFGSPDIVGIIGD